MSRSLRVLVAISRVWLPLAIFAAGVAGIIIGHGRTGAAASGVGLVIVAIIVWMLGWMYRMSLDSNRDRDVEEAARDYYTRHGHWPGEGPS
jgi:hypothetical protein